MRHLCAHGLVGLLQLANGVGEGDHGSGVAKVRLRKLVGNGQRILDADVVRSEGGSHFAGQGGGEFGDGTEVALVGVDENVGNLCLAH